MISYALQVLGALLILLIGWNIANWTKRKLRSVLATSKTIDQTLVPLLSEIARYAVLILVVIAVLSRFGIQTASIVTVLGGATIAIGLALQGTLSNIASGIMLLFLRPFNIGDFIDAEGIMGTVDAINLFTTQMTTFDGIYQEVPNTQLWNRMIRNLSRNPRRRIDLFVGISYSDDIATAKAVLWDILNADERVLKDPAAEVMVAALGESSVNLKMHIWVESANYFPVLFDTTERVKIQLEAASISIPFPQRDVHLIQEGNG
ncbi:MAG: mechanosensitive ion channel [Synechococcaceae cyanobacterium SM2_3_60]|nr:mechanosensitive ion channel [Synechococcaceae cyanobacterium SM2_3_60]